MRWIAIALILLAASLGYAKDDAAKQEQKEAVLLEITLYRVNGSVSGDFSLTDSIFDGLDSPTAEQKKAFTYFTIANTKLGSVRFVADDDGWTWDGKKEPTAKGKVSTVCAPKLMVNVGQEAKMTIGGVVIDSTDEKPTQYFEQRPDGLYELKAGMIELGMSVGTTVERGEGERINLVDLAITFRTLETITNELYKTGVSVVAHREYKTTVALQPGRDYGLMIRTQSQGMMLARIRVSPSAMIAIWGEKAEQDEEGSQAKSDEGS